MEGRDTWPGGGGGRDDQLPHLDLCWMLKALTKVAIAFVTMALLEN